VSNYHLLDDDDDDDDDDVPSASRSVGQSVSLSVVQTVCQNVNHSD